MLFKEANLITYMNILYITLKNISVSLDQRFSSIEEKVKLESNCDNP